MKLVDWFMAPMRWWFNFGKTIEYEVLLDPEQTIKQLLKVIGGDEWKDTPTGGYGRTGVIKGGIDGLNFSMTRVHSGVRPRRGPIQVIDLNGEIAPTEGGCRIRATLRRGSETIVVPLCVLGFATLWMAMGVVNWLRIVTVRGAGLGMELAGLLFFAVMLWLCLKSVASAGQRDAERLTAIMHELFAPYDISSSHQDDQSGAGFDVIVNKTSGRDQANEPEKRSSN